MMNYEVLLNTEEEKQIFINCQHLELKIKGVGRAASGYPFTIEDAEKVATKGEALGCWI